MGKSFPLHFLSSLKYFLSLEAKKNTKQKIRRWRGKRLRETEFHVVFDKVFCARLSFSFFLPLL